MAWTYYIYSSLTVERIQELESKYSEAFSNFLEKHPELADTDESTGMVFVGSLVPSVDEVVAANAEFEISIHSTILDRLKDCRSVIEIENPVSPESSRLQVTTLRFLLENSDKAIMDWGDYQLQLSEKALAKIKGLDSFGEMGASSSGSKAPAAPVKEAPGEFRAKHIVHLFHMAEENHELAIDLQKMITRQPEPIQKYLAHLFSHGPMGDAEAAKGLAIPAKTLTSLMPALEKALAAIVDDDE